MNSDRTALFVTLKRWKSFSINQLTKFATVTIVAERHSQTNSNISYSNVMTCKNDLQSLVF